MKENLKQLLERALKEHWALPHFNVSNLEQMRGVCEAAKALCAPMMVGTSEGEREFIGLKQAVALVAAYRENNNLLFFLNADHCKSVRSAKQAIDAGYLSVHIDLSKEPDVKNFSGAREIVQYARKAGSGISVEGELGYLATDASKIYKEKIKIDPATFTKPEEAARYVRETGVDRFAPAVGNLHGISANRPKLDFALIKKLRAVLPARTAMVLHGGSGNSAEVFRKAIDLGFNNIHISTELRLAYANALKKTVKENPEELAPYKLMAPVVLAVQKKAEEFIKIFKADGKA